MEYLGNPLNDFGLYTYDLSIHQIRKDMLDHIPDCLTPRNLIISNSQSSRYKIQSLEHDLWMSAGQMRNTAGSGMSLSVTEPNGSSLLSRILEVSVDQERLAGGGGGNSRSPHMKALYVVTVSFKGRDAGNRPMRYKHDFRYVAVITKLSSSVSSSGTNYSIDMYHHGYNAGFSASRQTVKGAIALSARSMGELVDRLNLELQRADYDAWESDESSLFYDKRSIVFDDTAKEWRSWTFQQLEDESKSMKYDVVSGEMQFSIPPGSRIADFLDMALRATREYKQVQKFGGGFVFDESGRVRAGEDMGKPPVFFRLLVHDVEYRQYDPLRNEHEKHIVFAVAAHAEPAAVPSPAAYHRAVGDAAKQRGIVENLRRDGFLRKRYVHMFGETANTEIMDFSYDFDNTYFHMTPHGGGSTGDHDAQAPASAKSTEDFPGNLVEIKRKFTEAAKSAREAALAGGRGGSSPPQPLSREEMVRRYREFEESLPEGVGRRPVMMPLTFDAEPVPESAVIGPENDRTGNRIRFGAVKANLESSGDMNEVELTIRGDPYWLGQPSRFGMHGEWSDGDLADYEKGGALFFYHTHFPHAEEDSTGRRRPRTDYMMTAVYQVTKVTSRFEGGRFVQTLTAYRHSVVNPTPDTIGFLTADDGFLDAPAGLPNYSPPGAAGGAKTQAQNQEDQGDSGSAGGGGPDPYAYAQHQGDLSSRNEGGTADGGFILRTEIRAARTAGRGGPFANGGTPAG